MKFDIFAKHRTGSTAQGDGKMKAYDFYSYTTRLTKKDGEVITAGVKFHKEITPPDGKACPCTISVKRNDMNLAQDMLEYRDEEGNITEVKTVYTLWVKAYTQSEYVDHSLDDFVTEDDDE